MISIFASGCSVSDLSSYDLMRIYCSSDIITTNYPLTLRDHRIISTYHAFGDKDTAIWANQYFKNTDVKLITRKVIAENYKKLLQDVKLHAVIDQQKYEPWHETTFMLSLQWALDTFPRSDIYIYGLDFVTRENYNRWYDEFVQEKNERGYPKFTRESYEHRMLKRKKEDGWATDNFLKTWELWYKHHAPKERLTFKGIWKP